MSTWTFQPFPVGAPILLAPATTPIILNTSSGADVGDQTSHTISLPATVAYGDRIVVALGCTTVSAVTWPAGWTEIVDSNTASANISIAYRDCDGTESGGTVVPTTPGGELFSAAWVVIHLQAGSFHSSAPEVATSYTGSPDTAPDPPSLTPSWGSTETLWLAFAAGSRTPNNTHTVAPTGFSGLLTQTATSGTAQGNIGYAYKEERASSQDPSAFTTSASDIWVGATVAIRGAAVSLLNTQTFYSHTVSVSAGGTTVEPPLLTNASTLRAHSVRARLSPSLLTNSSTLRAHSVRTILKPTNLVNASTLRAHSIRRIVKPSALANSSTLRAHSIRTILKPTLYTNTNTFYSHTVSAAAIIKSPPLLTNANTLRAHSIRTILKPTAFTNSSTLRAHSVRTILRPAILTNSSTLNAHSVRTRLTAPLLTNANTLRAHSVRATVKPVNFVNASTLRAHSIRTILKPGLLSNANTFYAHAVAVAGADLQVPLLVNSQTFYAHKIVTRVTASLLTNANTLNAHSIRRTLRPTNLTNSQTFFAHRIRTTIRPTNYVNSQTFQAHSIRRIITSALLTNSQQFFGHTVLAGNNVSVPHLLNVNTFGAHTVIVSAAPEVPQTGNFGGYISSPIRKKVDRDALRREALKRIKALYSVTAGVPYIPSTNRLYAPTLIIGPAPEEDDFGLSPVEIDEITDILDALEAIEAMEAINDIAGRAS